jgi:radical SAM-linked protein
MPLIQYGPALGVGTVGENELIDFDSFDELDGQDFLPRINGALPGGLRFKRLEPLPAHSQALIKEINRAEYSVPLNAPEIRAAIERARQARRDLAGAAAEQVCMALAEDFLSRESCVIERVRRDKRQKVDVRRYTHRLEIDDRANLRIVTEISANGGVKPTEVLAAVFDLTEDERVSLNSRVRRLRLFKEEAINVTASTLGAAASQSSAQE